ncbi:MAG: phospho-N-acetylmuramoyl-pentapeptide-transferase [Firmicutes bacterium]|nr:phospho-N-acetylmuramoyl-pentapeptide-transferase [Bacillota bacterium]
MQQIALSALTGFVAQLILCPFLIPVLKKLKFGQYIREEGPKAHQKKAGTPTMGGISILASFILGLIPSLAFFSRYWIVPAVTLMFGLIGFLDDYIKVVMKHNEGLKPYQKFSLQILFAALFALYLYLTGHETTITIHLLDLKLDLGIGYYFFVIFVMCAVVNGTNFNDGLDGLSSSVTAVICAFFMAVVLLLKDFGYLGAPAGAFFGALIGFLFYNAYPAKVFMGDTGSLALGGFVTSMAFLMDMPLLILVFGFIYVAEVVSVILQVAYFKATGGKRLFKMAPIHHHFELMGWHETKVVTVFAGVTALLCLVSLWILL